MFQGLEHTAIATPEPEKLARWYVEVLGFVVNYRYDGNVFVRAPNGSMLEIIPSKGERAPQKLTDAGIRHLAIAVDDFDAAHEQLKASGVKIISDVLQKGTNRLLMFEDLDGNYLHLIERETPLP